MTHGFGAFALVAGRWVTWVNWVTFFELLHRTSCNLPLLAPSCLLSSSRFSTFLKKVTQLTQTHILRSLPALLMGHRLGHRWVTWVNSDDPPECPISTASTATHSLPRSRSAVPSSRLATGVEQGALLRAVLNAHPGAPSQRRRHHQRRSHGPGTTKDPPFQVPGWRRQEGKGWCERVVLNAHRDASLDFRSRTPSAPDMTHT